MALIFMDGFDHYGSDRNNMADGVYASLEACALATTPVRTGIRSLRPGGIRRVLGGEFSVVGFGTAVYYTSLPITNYEIISFRNIDNQDVVNVRTQSTGVIDVRVGSTIVAQTISPVLTANAWFHVEIKVDCNTSTVEVRVNGVTVLNESNIGGFDDIAQIDLGDDSSSFYMDDIFCWNDIGTVNNDFLGDLRVRTLFANSDQATQEWSVVGAATGNNAINEESPDDDSSYIEASPSAPVTSEFGIDDLPLGVGAIFGVQSYVRQRKTDAGDANTQVSMLSGGSVSNGIDRPITTEYTYWTDIFELDPNTGSAWTVATLNAATFRIRRTV